MVRQIPKIIIMSTLTGELGWEDKSRLGSAQFSGNQAALFLPLYRIAHH